MGLRKPDRYIYCGEYWDNETGTYYLQARYYAPHIGRFTQQDTHSNTANSIYGDNPQTVNQHEDALGLKAYTHIPQITAVMQSGNLYAYAVNNPSAYSDHNGEIALEAAMLFIAANPEVVALIATGVLAGLVYLGHQSVELLERAMNSQAWKQIEAAIQNAVSGSAAAAPGAPDPEDEPERKENPNKNESKVWKRFDNVKNSKLKTSGKGTNKKYYDWDHTHNDIEVYNAQGKHLGSMDPTTGEMYKPAVPGRSIKVP